MAPIIRQHNIDPGAIYYLDGADKNYSMEFSLHTLVPAITADSLKKRQQPTYLFVDSNGISLLREHNIAFDMVIQESHYNVSTLSYKFLNPATRHQALTLHFIIKVK